MITKEKIVQYVKKYKINLFIEEKSVVKVDVLVVPFNIFPDQQFPCMVIKPVVEDYLIFGHQFFFMKKVEPWVSN